MESEGLFRKRVKDLTFSASYRIVPSIKKTLCNRRQVNRLGSFRRNYVKSMIVIMLPSATEKDIQDVVHKIEEMGYQAHKIKGEERTVIAAVGDKRGKPSLQVIEQMHRVESVVPILKEYKLASREVKPEPTIIDVQGVKFGGKKIQVIAGPCSVEGKDQVIGIARDVKRSGATVLRGGAFKPRTSPYTFQGMAEEGLKLLDEARKATGLPIVTEVMDSKDVELIDRYSDILQIGTRNAQNFSLLKEVGQCRKPVLLKRGLAMTIKEYLMAAEYILANGNQQVILCERGIRTFENATRNTLDLSAIPVLKEQTHLPVIVDPSHGTGYWQYVNPMAKAAVAAGADGLMIEVHNCPEEALSDGPQSLKPKKFDALMKELRLFAQAAGREL